MSVQCVWGGGEKRERECNKQTCNCWPPEYKQIANPVLSLKGINFLFMVF